MNIYATWFCLLSALFPVNSKAEQSVKLWSTLKAERKLHQNSNFLIEKHETVIIDASMDVGLLWIKGQLICDNKLTPDHSVVRTQGMLIMGQGAKFICGSKHAPFLKKIQFLIHGDQKLETLFEENHHEHQSTTHTNLGIRAIVAMMGGEIHMHGSSSSAKNEITFLSQKLKKGSMGFRVLDLQNWNIGDEILVASSHFDMNQTEVRKVSHLNKQTGEVNVDKPFEFDHTGAHQEIYQNSNQKWAFTKSAEVANLTRNIRIESEEAQFGLGAHLMVMKDARAFLDGVQFVKMGQMGVMGRYPIHWHLLLTQGHGQYLKNSSIVSSFQRCVVIHRTHGIRVENNICYNHFGHGMMLEDGDERDNFFIKNLVLNSKVMPAELSLLQSEFRSPSMKGLEERFSAPASFWISNPQNTIVNNISGGSQGTGFWMSFSQALNCDARGEFPCTESRPNKSTLQPAKLKTLQFDNNSAHSNLVSFTWDGGPNLNLKINNPRNPNDLGISTTHYHHTSRDPNHDGYTPTFRNLTSHSSYTGIYYRGAAATFENTILADHQVGVFFAYNQTLTHSLLIGMSSDFSIDDYKNTRWWQRGPIQGVRLYDGPLELSSVHFAGFPETNQFLFWNGSKNVSFTPVVFQVVTGSSKFENFSRDLSFSGAPRFLLRSTPLHTDAQYSTVVRDLDGSLTGVPGNLLLPKHPLTSLPGDCTDITRSDAAVSCAANLEVGFLDVWPDPKLINLSKTGHRSFAIKLTDSKNHHQVEKPRTRANAEHLLLVFNDPTRLDRFEYQISDFVHDQKKINLSESYMAYHSNQKNQVSPLLKFQIEKEYQHCTAYTSKNNILKNYPRFLNRDALAAANSEGYFYRDSSLFIKLISQDIKPGSASANATTYTSNRVYVECK